jgi:AraC-like DNA-binding protein
MNDNRKLPIYYLGQIKNTLASWHLDTDAWLAMHHLTSESINDINNNIDYQTFESLLLNAIEISGEKSLGLHIGSRLGVTTHGMMGYAMINSDSIREAIDIFRRFINTRTPLITIDIIETPETLTVQFNEVHDISPIRQAFHEAVLLTLNNILSYISFGDINILKAYFCFPRPEYGSLYDEFFHCEIQFFQRKTALTVSLSGLDNPLKMSDANSLTQARNLCELELKKMGQASSNEQKIKEILINSVGKFPSLEQLAARFHVSPRTLHRYLKNENTSYKEIIESVGSQLAKQYLTESDIGIQEISYLLGYKDIANFRRAFKRWYGVPPSEYRNIHGA